MIQLVVLVFVFSTVHGAIPPIVKCTRYLEPCVSKKGDCCGYPFFDCINDGRQPLCQWIEDFPELGAELLLKLRGAKDKGDPAVKQIHDDVYKLLGASKKKSSGGGKKKGKSSKKKGGKGGKKKSKKNKKKSKKNKKKSKKKTKKTKDD